MKPPIASSEDHLKFGRQDYLVGLTFILLLSIQFLWAVHLNKQLYQVHGPFYDSISYYGEVADVYHHVFEDDWLSALDKVLHRVNGMLPQLILLPLASVFGYTRVTGIFIQSLALLFLAISLYTYFRTVHRQQRWFAIVLSLPFLSLGAIYNFNGGLSDFRMDLLLYLGTACSACWYLIARDRPEGRWRWVALGICASATVLTRGTAPVYLVIMLGPIFAMDVLSAIKDRERLRSLFIGASITALIGLLACTWFFVLNFDDLYYYYFIWNADANAKLPLAIASTHIEFVFWHIGPPLFWGGIIAAFTGFFSLLLKKPKDIKKLILSEFPALWLWAAPLCFLVLRGAGLNPFVSMPAAFGMVLAIILPVAYNRFQHPFRIFLAAILIGVCLISAATGVKKHHQPGINNADAYANIHDLMEKDAKPSKHEVSFGTYTCGWALGAAYRNYLIFDAGYNLTSEGLVKDGLTVTNQDLSPAVLVDWEKIAGTNDEERIHSLTATLLTKADYILIPEPETIRFLSGHLSFNYINRFADQITQILLQSGQLEPISGEDPLVFNPNEKFRLYRNNGIR